MICEFIFKEVDKGYEATFPCAGKSRVINSRKYKDGVPIRRRECVRCGHRWTTKEVIIKGD